MLKKRTLPKEVEGEVEVRFSDDRSLFYLPEFVDTRGFWMTVASRPNPPQPTPLGGLFSNWAEFTPTGETPYYREVKWFAFWKVRCYQRLQERLPMATPMVLDYLAVLAMRADREKGSG